MKFKDLREQKEPKLIQEGTWKIPKTMKELDKLAEMLKSFAVSKIDSNG